MGPGADPEDERTAGDDRPVDRDGTRTRDRVSAEDRGSDREGGRASATGGREFGWRGWVLVGFVLVAFFVVPGALLTFAYAREFVGSLGLGWRQAYLVLPLLPALILGALAVWATTRP